MGLQSFKALSSEERVRVLAGLKIKKTEWPILWLVSYQGEAIGLIGQSPYNSLVWAVQGVSDRRFYCKTDAAPFVLNSTDQGVRHE